MLNSVTVKKVGGVGWGGVPLLVGRNGEGEKKDADLLPEAPKQK